MESTFSCTSPFLYTSIEENKCISLWRVYIFLDNSHCGCYSSSPRCPTWSVLTFIMSSCIRKVFLKKSIKFKWKWWINKPSSEVKQVKPWSISPKFDEWRRTVFSDWSTVLIKSNLLIVLIMSWQRNLFLFEYFVPWDFKLIIYILPQFYTSFSQKIFTCLLSPHCHTTFFILPPPSRPISHQEEGMREMLQLK